MSNKNDLDIALLKLGEASPAGYHAGLHIRFATPLITFQTYDQRWTDYYTEQAYVLRDPMIAWGFSTIGALRWSEIPVPDTFGIFEQAKEYGMNFGVAVAFGPMSSRTIVGASRSDREFTDAEIADISALVQILHEATEPPGLTEAQKEALQLIASGDRYAAAAAKLGISESALKARLHSVKEKLLARTTAEAIQRAKDYRLL